MRLLLIYSLFICSNAIAQVTLPHDLQPNTKASASKVMENFNALKEGIESLPTPPSDCTTDQIIKWSGTEWTCTDNFDVMGWWRLSYWFGEDPGGNLCRNAFDEVSRNVQFDVNGEYLTCRADYLAFSVNGIQYYTGCTIALEENSGFITLKDDFFRNYISYNTDGLVVGEPAKFVLSCPSQIDTW